MPAAEPAGAPTAERGKLVCDFAYHLVAFLFVHALLVILDLRGGTGDQAVLGLDWAYWLVLFWGFGLAGHAVHVFVGRRGQ